MLYNYRHQSMDYYSRSIRRALERTSRSSDIQFELRIVRQRSINHNDHPSPQDRHRHHHRRHLQIQHYRNHHHPPQLTQRIARNHQTMRYWMCQHLRHLLFLMRLLVLKRTLPLLYLCKIWNRPEPVSCSQAAACYGHVLSSKTALVKANECVTKITAPH